jgi:hydrogenase small subunit
MHRPYKDWINDLSQRAGYVVAVGDCACWGGIPAAEPNPTGATGIQFHKAAKGGFLGPDYRSQAGLPVVNIPGCPAHPDWMTQTLMSILVGRGADIVLDEFQRPADVFAGLAHDGCTRNEYFEFKVDGDFGEKEGCLFGEHGCQGTLTHSSCNRILWNRQSSKTRAGVPCFGCTEPDFPTFDFFHTKKGLGGIPAELPLGVSRARYVAMAGAAMAACTPRLKKKMIEGRS